MDDHHVEDEMELESLRARIAGLEKDDEVRKLIVEDYQRKAEALRAENAKLLKDKERLSWLAANVYVGELGHHVGGVGDDPWDWRAAIDAAKGEE